MFTPSESEFLELAKRGNLIPVYTEILADVETPVSAFRKIEDGPYGFLLESVEGGEKIGRYSFLGIRPRIVFRSWGRSIEVEEGGSSRSRETEKDPLEDLKGIMGRYRPVAIPDLPRFSGGAVGYLSYDMVRFFERIPEENPDPLDLPDSFFLVTDALLIFDHVRKTIKVLSNAFVEESPARAYAEAKEKIQYLLSRLSREVSIPPAPLVSFSDVPPFHSNCTKEEFKESVRRAKDYIAAGDAIQVVLSQRLEVGAGISPFNIYRALRSVNPSPYMFYLKGPDFHLVGSSPEIMVRFEDGKVELRPIAGTRKRGATEEEDRRLEVELLADPKERAEHIMLVDLGRNDVGRVCRYETVHVPELMVIERYSHVMHIVSGVVGEIASGRDAFDVIRASFPAGTVSGAPKVRAMEIIEELESVRRGPYAGAVGYFSFSGNLDSCITIRTVVIKDGKAFVQAGAGIVADSDPEREYHETLSKARAMLQAISQARAF